MKIIARHGTIGQEQEVESPGLLKQYGAGALRSSGRDQSSSCPTHLYLSLRPCVGSPEPPDGKRRTLQQPRGVQRNLLLLSYSRSILRDKHKSEEIHAKNGDV